MASPMFRLDEVRESVKRMQAEGERLVGRIRDDARTLIEKRPDVSQLREDVRQRAEKALEDVQARRTELRRSLEKLARQVRDGIVSTLRVADVTQLQEISRRLADIERRVEEIARSQKTDKAEEKAA